MELLFFTLLFFALPIYVLWQWGKRKDELTNRIDKMVAKYTAIASIITPDIQGENDWNSYRKVVSHVLNRAYNAKTANRISEIIFERVSRRDRSVMFRDIYFEGVIAQMEYEDNKHMTKRQRNKISNIMFRVRPIDEYIWQ